jgi:hypothetical protein
MSCQPDILVTRLKDASKRLAILLIAIGIDCTKSSLAWAVVDGTDPSNAVLREAAKADMPKNISRGDGLDWIYLETLSLARRTGPISAAIKRAELGQSARGASLEHAEVDGVVQAALSRIGIATVALPWATLARRMGAANRASAMQLVRFSVAAEGIPVARHVSIAAALAALVV